MCFSSFILTKVLCYWHYYYHHNFTNEETEAWSIQITCPRADNVVEPEFEPSWSGFRTHSLLHIQIFSRRHRNMRKRFQSMWSNSRHGVASVLWNGVFFVPKNEQDKEKYTGTQVSFPHLKHRARSRNNVEVFSTSPPPACRPQGLRVSQPKQGVRPALDSLDIKVPGLPSLPLFFLFFIPCLFAIKCCFWNSFYLIPGRNIRDSNAYRYWGWIIVP